MLIGGEERTPYPGLVYSQYVSKDNARIFLTPSETFSHRPDAQSLTFNTSCSLLNLFGSFYSCYKKENLTAKDFTIISPNGGSFEKHSKYE